MQKGKVLGHNARQRPVYVVSILEEKVIELLFVICYKGKAICPPLPQLAATEKMSKLSRSFSNLELVEVPQQSQKASNI
ncbi:hypothetical protein [Paenibacillus ferrarius]|uniref:hypothetical protein n=1 Tax=Paenibacillus ferrarius TaxID=1469647 RepID=UPI003D272368